jgi:hypothetical protein
LDIEIYSVVQGDRKTTNSSARRKKKKKKTFIDKKLPAALTWGLPF